MSEIKSGKYFCNGTEMPQETKPSDVEGEFDRDQAKKAFYTELPIYDDACGSKAETGEHCWIEGARWMFDRMRGGKK